MSITVLAIVLLFGMSVPANADLVSSEKVTETIDSQLQTLLKEADSGKRIPVDIWLYEMSTVEEREQKIFSKIGLNKAKISLDTRNTVSAEKIDEYIVTERELYAAEMERQYAALRLEYADVTALQTTRKTDTRLFYSQYAPMISAELTSAEIKLLARDDRVQAVYYSPDVTFKDAGNISIPAIGANCTRDTLGYTGSGIKIGMYESGVPNENSGYFAKDNIYYEDIPDIADRYTDHANTVAAIMVGQATVKDGIICEGIVPDAELYATCPIERNDWRARIEWLISQGVHVINMSTSITNDGLPGQYNTETRWVDHVANNHRVHFVVAAGNSGEMVTPPGMGYNVLTVGAINDNNTLQQSDDVIYDDDPFASSYMESAGLTNKPDLVAPGVNIFTAAYVDEEDYTNSGTSFAAPHVTAVVAQLCQRFPSLRTIQAGVKAILTASISHSKHKYTPVDEKYDKFGAGVVNARAAMETANAYRMMVGSFSVNTPANAERTYTFTVPARQCVRVSLTWQKYAAISSDTSHENYDPLDYALSDLDLYVIHPEGADIEYSTEIYNNTEIVDFVAPVAGTYQMVVTNRLVTEQVVNYGISWWFGEIVDSD